MKHTTRPAGYRHCTRSRPATRRDRLATCRTLQPRAQGQEKRPWAAAGSGARTEVGSWLNDEQSVLKAIGLVKKSQDLRDDYHRKQVARPSTGESSMQGSQTPRTMGCLGQPSRRA